MVSFPADLLGLVWGSGDIKPDLFGRWSQGFVFSQHERTALIQADGGPCAVIAPVQAFLLKCALFDKKIEWSAVTAEEMESLLISALTEILTQCLTTGTYRITIQEPNNNDNDQPDSETFHKSLKVVEITDPTSIAQHLSPQQPHAILRFLYSLILTKELEQVRNEMQDPTEPLIDATHGHGSQSLINLVLTGKAVPGVWDNEREVGGMKLRGVNRQCPVGFLTILEHLRLCQVGSYLKNPIFPVWLLGSETHLTVFFSKERNLCGPETEEMNVQRVFSTFDPEGNRFIPSSQLGDLFQALDLYSEPEYVEVMRKKLDEENLGIILYSKFMQEFYPETQDSQKTTSFPVYHYNGLPNSCPDHKVCYISGTATIMDFDVKILTSASPILLCLQTKWHGIDIEWESTVPSLN